MNSKKIILKLIIATVLTIFATFAPKTMAANGKIVFVENGGIFTMNPNGTGKRFLVNGSKPEYSPDGQQIAYYSSNNIRVTSSHGGNDYSIALAGPLPAFRTVELSWSPDGNRIAFTCQPGICTVNRNGTNFTVISSDTRDDAPKWSPDGTKFVFLKRPFLACNHECLPDIWVMNSDGSGQTRLTMRGDFTLLGGPVWSPDGTRIAYAYNFLGFVLGISIMNADGSNPRVLIEGSDLGGILPSDPTWSPDGTKIAFAGDPVFSTNSYLPDIYAIDLDGTYLRNLTQAPGIACRIRF